MKTAFEEIMDVRDMGMPSDRDVRITGCDPVYSTRFRIGETCAAALAANGVAISDIWEMKTGRRQKVEIDVRPAAATLRGKHYMQRRDANGRFRFIRDLDYEMMIKVTQPWPTRDGRWFLPHFGLPNLRERVLRVLDCDFEPESIGKAVAKRDALELESAIDEARACGAMVRTNSEWMNHEHGQVLAAKPVVEISKIGDSDPKPFPIGDSPLSGIRALDLTRILAGPVAARTLAEHGADVLMVTAEHLPQINEDVIDTSHGKRSCFLNLNSRSDALKLNELVQQTDIFSQGYRPGTLSQRGFGPEQLAGINPGIIYLSINCFGDGGPLSHRAGWEQIAQTVTGICDEGGDDAPALLPAPANDFTTGYLGAYGVLLALARRAREGGSYHVRVSLCRSAMLIYRQGKLAHADPGMDLTEHELDMLRIESETARGPLRHLAPVLTLSETRPHWSLPTPVLGGDAPEFLSTTA